MSIETKKEKVITLEDLGVNPDIPIINQTPAEIPVKAPKENKKSTILTPDKIGAKNQEKKLTPINIQDIAPFEKVIPAEKQFEKKELDLIEKGIERTKKDLLENVINPLKDKVVTARLEADAENVERADVDFLGKMRPLDTSDIKSNENKIIDNVDLSATDDISRFNIDDSDLKELMDDDTEETQDAKENDDDENLTDGEKEKKKKETEEEKKRQDELFKNYQTQIQEKVRAVSSNLDLKGFKISTKPIAITHALRHSVKAFNTAQWGLPNSKRLITFSGLNGEEITNLNPENFQNRLQAFRTAYSIMYNHLVDSNKPTTLEAWLKTICGFDIDHLYFCLYKATFGKTNFITYNCPTCANLELKEKNIDDMVVYPNDAVKASFQKLLTTGEDTTPSILEPKLVQISDNYAFSLRAPSIWGLIFETSALDEAFSTKYADILSILAYIENVYMIDEVSHSIIPIDINPVPDNMSKTVRRKVIAYYNIIKQLNSDQYSLIGAEITKIAQVLADNITYQIPEENCTGKTKTGKACTHHFDINPQTPLQLLFSRHQLVAIGSY